MRSAFRTKKVALGMALGRPREWQQGALRLQVVRRKVTGPLPGIGVSRVPVERGLSWTLGPTSEQPTALRGLWEKVWLCKFGQKQSLALSELV